jgi:erythronate-4-phosphate dehydrogenase
MQIIADDKIPYLKGVLEPYAYIVYMPGPLIDKEAVLKADALLIRTRTRCNASLLEGTAVKFIATATIGFDHIDTAYCERSNIFWTNAPGCNSGSVQQYIASTLATIAIDTNLSLRGKTLGIVGVGNVGSKVEKTARALGMNVLLNDPPRARKEDPGLFVPLAELLEKSDIVTIHVPLNREGEDKTFHLFGREILHKMKPGAWLINSSRGEVVETDEMKQVLKENFLRGSVLDVWEQEPHIDPELLDLVYIGTPHIAGYSADGKANGTAMSVQALSRFFKLPLQNWYPQSVPKPQNDGFLLDAKGKTPEMCSLDAILRTFKVKEDDARLRNSPESFEKLRGSYPLRREFSAYTIKITNPVEETIQIVKNIGFSVERG